MPLDLDPVLDGKHGVAILAKDVTLEQLGDVNGDGLDDVALRNYVIFSESGAVPIIDSDAELSTRGFRVEHSQSMLPPGLRPAGDVNGDGLADILVVQGGLWVLFGKKDLNPVETDDIGAGAGGFSIPGAMSARALGDIDGDGLGELAIYADEEPTRVIRGKDDGSPLDIAAATFVEFTQTVSLAGDVDGDGVKEFLACGELGVEIISAPNGWNQPESHVNITDHPCGPIELEHGPIDNVLASHVVASEWPYYPGRLFKGPLPLDKDVVLPYEGSIAESLINPPLLVRLGEASDRASVVATHYNNHLDKIEVWVEPIDSWEMERSYCSRPGSLVVYADFPQRAINVKPIGDVNGDGRGDLLISEYGTTAILTEVCDRK